MRAVRQDMKSPLLALAACFALGIALGRTIEPLRSAPLRSLPLLLGGAAACLLVGLLALRAPWTAVSTLLAFAGFALAGAAAARLFEFRFPSNHLSHLESRGIDVSQPVRLEGRLVSAPQRTPYGSQFDVEASRIAGEKTASRARSVSGLVRLRLESSEDPDADAAARVLDLKFGDYIRATVRLRRPQTYRNPGSFDFRHWMESIEDIYWVGTIPSPLLIERPAPQPPPDRVFEQRHGLSGTVRATVSSLIEGVRRRLLQCIDRLYPPWLPEGKAGAVLKAVLLGDRSSLDSDTIEGFRKVGLYHLLVIAGLHVGLLAGLAEGFLRLLRFRETSRSVLVLVFLLSFASLVEQRAPTLRATLMIVGYLLARLLYREQPALNAAGLAALVLLFLRPAWLFESGFELSFSAALLIAGLAVPILERTTEPYLRALWQLDAVDLDPSLEPRQAQVRVDLRALVGALKARSRLLDRHPAAAERMVTGPARFALWMANMLLFSAVLQFGLLLPMAQTFHRVTYAGIGLNAVAIPVMTVILLFAVPTVVLGTLAPGLAAWPAKALALVMQGLFALTDLPHLPRWLSYRVPSPPDWVAWGFALSIVAAGWTLGRRARAFWISLAASVFFAILISLHPFPPRLPSGIMEVTVLDCGGGDALFVVLPDGATLLLGAGGGRSAGRGGTFARRRWDPGEDIVSPYLWSRGVKKIDALVLDDTRESHLGGMAAVVANFRVGEFWHGPAPYARSRGRTSTVAAPAYEALLDELAERRIPMREVAAGAVISLGGAFVHILWPASAAGGTPDADPSGRRKNAHLSPTSDSLALRISSGAVSVLLPGDLDEQGERELVESGVPLASELLKVARHGAKTSSSREFVARVSPRIAVVAAESAGHRNSPSPETLDRLRSAGARIFRTDMDGAVTVEMRGASLAARGFARAPGGESHLAEHR